ncbi:hypothetical protein H311_00444 [Anncaliia algerae PRA109]|nr:hypothetical protein H311_00444 [Anncaliia algerae PRA109]
MNISIETYIKSLQEKLDKDINSLEYDDIEDINTLSDIIEHLIRTTSPHMNELKQFIKQKKIIKKINDKIKRTNKNVETQPLVNRNQFILKSAGIEDLPERIDEIVCINDCISSSVSYQGSVIDNLNVQMNREEEVVNNQNNELYVALRHQKRRNRIYNFFLILFAIFVFVLLTVRVILR